MAQEPFWRTTPLAAMSEAQWESLCDGCGRCCLVKLEDEDTGAVAYTDVGCRLLDAQTCRCTDYDNRSALVADCVRLTAEAVPGLTWLPPTCAYRLVFEGKDLPFWHPLVSGDPASVTTAGVSVAGKLAGAETAFGLFELLDHIVSWPVRWPRGARGRTRKTTKMSTKAAAAAPASAAGPGPEAQLAEAVLPAAGSGGPATPKAGARRPPPAARKTAPRKTAGGNVGGL